MWPVSSAFPGLAAVKERLVVQPGFVVHLYLEMKGLPYPGRKFST